MRLAYADPPYLGCSHLYPEHPNAADYDDPKAHARLAWEMSDNYDGWALSMSVPSLRYILPLLPANIRVLAWVKPFAAFKKNVNPSSAWEPLVVWGGRGRSDENTYMRDWVGEPVCAESITIKRGLTGAKPKRLMWWLFDVWNAQPGDEFVDLFPGTGACSAAWDEYVKDYETVASAINRVSVRWEMGKGVLR